MQCADTEETFETEEKEETDEVNQTEWTKEKHKREEKKDAFEIDITKSKLACKGEITPFGCCSHSYQIICIFDCFAVSGIVNLFGCKFVMS